MRASFPNLFIPGAAKSGTSSLHNVLNQHEEIYMSKVKEPHFFSHTEFYSSERDRANYQGLFEEGANCRYRGESSTGYMVFPNVIERLKNDVPNPRFIFILRNPIDRAFSHYHWVKSTGNEKAEFWEAIETDRQSEPDPHHNWGGGYKDYFQFGLYGKWLSRFYENFERDSILVITFEEFTENLGETMNKCCDFLDLAPMRRWKSEVSNKTVSLRFPRFYHRAKTTYSKLSGTLPDHLRKKMRFNPLERLLSMKQKPLPLYASERLRLAHFYKGDVMLLKRSVDCDLTRWRDFA
jgi:hypothetical protein